MNERIKELADQMFSMEEFEYAEEFLNDAFMEKFAELIIEECAEFARQHNLEKADRSHMIHRAIKEHFGVEK